MVRKRDRFWEYAEDLKGRFKCKFCERDFAGGASRIKCHLAGVKGHDIDICTKVSKEVQEEAALIVGELNKKLKGASTSNRDKGREINSTSISKDVTLSRVFEKMVAILQRVLRLTQKAGEKFAFGKIIKLMTTVAKAVQGVVI